MSLNTIMLERASTQEHSVHLRCHNTDRIHRYVGLPLESGLWRCTLESRRWLSPISWVYILLPIALFLGGFALVRSGGAVLQAIGSSLIAAAVAGWVIFVYVRLSERKLEVLDALDRFGFVAAF